MLNWYLHIVKERSRKELEKLLEQLNQSEHHLYEIDVQNDEDIINGFSQIGKDVGQIDGVYHSIAFANMEDLRGRFSETSREGFLLAQEISSYSLTLVAHEAKNLCLKVEVLLRRLILVVRQQFKTIMLWV